MKRENHIPDIGEKICPARGEPVPYILGDGGAKQCVSSAVCGDKCKSASHPAQKPKKQ